MSSPCGTAKPIPLRNSVVVDTLGGEDVAYVIVYRKDGTLRAFYPDVPNSNTVQVSPFDPDTGWERQGRIQVLAWSEVQSLMFQQNPKKIVICESSDGVKVCQEVTV